MVKKTDGSANKKAGEHFTSGMNHGALMELSTRQLQPLDNSIPSLLPAGHENENVAVEDVEEQWIQTARRPSWMLPESIFERHEEVSPFQSA